jgi:hypothetical protein
LPTSCPPPAHLLPTWAHLLGLAHFWRQGGETVFTQADSGALKAALAARAGEGDKAFAVERVVRDGMGECSEGLTVRPKKGTCLRMRTGNREPHDTLMGGGVGHRVGTGQAEEQAYVQ